MSYTNSIAIHEEKKIADLVPEFYSISRNLTIHMSRSHSLTKIQSLHQQDNIFHVVHVIMQNQSLSKGL